jgi:hypothetical protein
MTTAKSPEATTGWKRLALWLAGGSSFLYVCSRFVPCAPPSFHGEIEDSFIQFLHTAFLERVQFGRDFVFNFGPWGFLYGGYHPATHLISVIAWLGLSLVFWWTGWRVARHFSKNELAAWLWLMAFAAVAGLPIFTLIEARLKALVVLLWLLHFFVEDRPFTVAQALLVVALGLVSLVKFNVLVDTAMILAVIVLDDVFRRRRFPWLLPLFGAAFLLFWIAARQPMSALGPFLRSVPLLTSGYTEGAMLTGLKPALDVSCFLLAAGMVCAVAGYASWLRHRFLGGFSLVGLGFLLFTAFKHGYVRQDFHEAAATLELLMISLASLAVAWPVAANHSRSATLASLVPTIAAGVLAAATFSRHFENGLPGHLLGTFSVPNLLAPAKSLLGAGNLRAGYDAYLAGIRDSSPLPPIQGQVDTYPGNASALLAWGFTYRPRPVMQSLVAYTPELAELNAAFLRSVRAPANIVFQIAPVDEHFPSLEDGRSWPELLTRYDIREVQWPFVLLKRSAAPRPWRLEPLADMPMRFGEVVDVPPATNGPVWASIEIDQTLVGRIASALYKPPILWLSVLTRGGGRLRYRLVPGMARSGFLLSPVVRDAVAFGELAADGGRLDLADQQADSLSLTADTGSGSTACYRPTVRLHLYRLEYPGQDLSKLVAFSTMKNLRRMAGRALSLHADYPPGLVYLPQCGSVLRVAPDSAIQWSVEGRPKRLKLGFGILAPGGAPLQATNGVIFRVSAVGGQGELVPLWSQRLDSLSGGFAQARQEAVIDLGRAQSSELILETLLSGAKQTHGPECYWSAIELE